MKGIGNVSRPIATEARDISHKSDCSEHPTESQTQFVFGYVAKAEDIISREPDIGVLLRRMLIALIVLGTTIAICLVLAIRQVPILLLLALPLLQQLAIAGLRKRIRRSYPMDIWIRGYSPLTPSATSLAEGHHHPDR